MKLFKRSSSEVEQTSRCNCIRNMGTSLQNAYQNFNRVEFQQGIARGIVSLVGKTTTAFLSTGLKKFTEIELERYASASVAKAISLPTAVGTAATAPITAAMMTVGAVDTVFQNMCAEEEKKETWRGTFKRNAPGLALSLGSTFITGATLPETLLVYSIYKVASRTMAFLREYGEDEQAQLVNYQLAYAQATAVAATFTTQEKRKKKIK